MLFSTALAGQPRQANSQLAFFGLTDYILSFFYGQDEPRRPVPSPLLDGESDVEVKAEYSKHSTESFAPPCAPTATTWNVPAGGDIQSVININANPGDKIVLAAGTYVQQIQINKCLFIEGAGIGQTIIKSPASLAASTIPGVQNTFSIVEVRSSAYVTMSDLTIEGPVPFMPAGPGTPTRTNGIFIAETATLNLSDARVATIWKSTGQDGIQDGTAIGVGRFAHNQQGELIANNITVDDYQKTGLLVDDTGSVATVTNSSINGEGPLGIIAQNGIQVGRGATGSFDNVNVTGHEYTGTSASSAGLLAFDTGAGGVNVTNSTFGGNDVGYYPFFSSNAGGPNTVTSNDLSGNKEFGLFFDGVNGNVSFNRITGNPDGGLGNTATSTVNAENNFWGCNAGPGGVGCDTVDSPSTTVDFSPWLVLSGASAFPTSVNTPGGTSAISGVSLRVNSDLVDTFAFPGNPSVKDGIVVAYSTSPGTYGSVSPNSGTFTDGLATGTTFTAGTGPFPGDQIETISGTVNNASSSANVTIEDTTAPTVTINQAVGQADPANSSPINFTVVFSESVGTSFISGDVTVGGIGGTAVVTEIAPNNGTTYNVAVTPNAANGLVTASLAAGVAQDLASNTSAASTSTDNTVAYFNAGPLQLVVDNDGFASAFSCADTTPSHATIQSAVAAAVSGNTIKVCPGTYQAGNTGGTVNLGQSGVTVIAAEATKPLVQVDGTADGFNVTATGVTIQNLEIVKIGTGDQHHMIRLQANNFTGSGNYIHGPTWQTPNHVSRAFIIQPGVTGFLIDSNIIEDLRQPAYSDPGTLGTVSNNTWTGTKGWVNDGGLITFTGNTMTTCAACDTDLALLNNANPAYQTFYADRLALSNANNNAHIDVQFTAANDSGRAVSYVNFGTGSSLNDGRVATPYQSIQQAVFNSAPGIVDGTLPGGTVNVAAGTYNEDVTVDRTLTIVGAGASTTTVSGPIGGSGSTFQFNASNVDLSGFTITRAGNNTTDWNNAGLNTAGIAIQGVSFTGNVIHDNIITGMRTAIDINNSNGHTIRNNRIDFNHTGLIFRNQTDQIKLIENEVTNNWTVGVLFIEASGGTNSPVQQSLNSTYSNNNVSGNWYGQIVDRQSGGALPTPGTTNLKNFQGNWLGTTTPVVTTANTTEPGYAAQIPAAYGGTATPPGGQPDVAGPASANLRFNQVLSNGTDTNVQTTPGRGTFGFQGAPIFVQSQSPTGWFFFNEGPTGSGNFAIGPSTPPIGDGSAHLFVDATGRQSMGTLNYGGIRLDTITELAYSSYQVSSNAAAAPSLQFDVDDDLTDANTAYQGRLVFEPYQTPSNTVLQSTWQNWDAMAGRWWGSAGSGTRPITAACPQSAPCTWSAILAAFPNAGIRPVTGNGVLLFRAGGPTGSNFDGYVDAFKISINTADTTFDFEPSRPTVTINQAVGQSDPTNTSPINFTAVFSTAVTGFNSLDIVLGGTAGANAAVVTEIAPNDGTTYNVSVSGMTGTGTVIASIPDSAANGIGGASEASTSTDNTVTYDVGAPSVTSLNCTPSGAGVFGCTVIFSEPVTGFADTDLTVTGGSVSGFGGTGTTYTFTLTQAGTLPATVQVPAGIAVDGANNPNTASAVVSVDNVGPTVTINQAGLPQTDPTSVSPIVFDVVFSEPVTGFGGTDISFAGSTTGGTLVGAVSGSGTTYTVSVSGMNASGLVIASVNAGAANDAATNASVASTSSDNQVTFSLTNNSVVVTPATLNGWTVTNNDPAVLTSFRSGPGTPPLGIGSLQFEIPAAPGSQAGRLHTGGHDGQLLSSITELSYSTFVQGPPAALQAPYLVLRIDKDGDGDYDERLFFEPVYQNGGYSMQPGNGPIPNQCIGNPNCVSVGSWQTWNALSGGWWLDSDGFGGPPLRTIAGYVAANPNAKIISSPASGPNPIIGGVTIQTGGGSPPWSNFVGNADKVVIGFSSANTTYDMEPTPPTVSVNDVTLNEGNAGTTTFGFNVSLSTVSQLDTTVRFSTSDGTATTADNDYNAVTNQLVTIPAGQTSATVNVNVSGDTLFENTETFTVTLSDPVNSVIADGTGTGTITNDEAQPTVSIVSTTPGSETGPTANTFTVSISGSSAFPISVNYATADGTAVTTGCPGPSASCDYSTTSGTINFAANTTTLSQTVNVPTLTDATPEPTENFTVNLSSPVNATIGTGTAIGTIADSGSFVSISGNVQDFLNPGLTGLANVTMTLQGSASGTTTTDASGNYTFNVGLPTGGNFLVTPSCPSNPGCTGRVFDPISRNYDTLTTNVTNANFIAYQPAEIPREVKVVTSYGTPGQNVVVPITIESQGNEREASFTLDYDPTLLTPVSPNPVACGADAPGCNVTLNQSASGKIGILVEPTGVLTAGTRELVTVTFSVSPSVTVSNSPVAFSGTPTPLSTSDAQTNPLATRYTTGTVVFAVGLECDVAGRFTGSGAVNTADTNLLRSFAVATATPNPSFNEFQRADCAPTATRGGGSINTGDVNQARAYSVGGTPQAAGGPFGAPMARPSSEFAAKMLGGAAATANVLSTTAAPGTSVTVRIRILTDGTVNGMQFSLDFDESVLTYQSVAPAAGMPPSAVLVTNTSQVATGRLGLAVDSGPTTPFGPAGAQDFITVTFLISPTATLGTTTPITFQSLPTDQFTSDLNNDEVVTDYNNGGVTIGNPTAAEASVSGQVVSSTGRAIAGATVRFMGDNGVARTAISSPFGYFTVQGLTVGRTYVVRTVAKRYTFEPRVVGLSDNMTGFDLVANP